MPSATATTMQGKQTPGLSFVGGTDGCDGEMELLPGDGTDGLWDFSLTADGGSSAALSDVMEFASWC